MTKAKATKPRTRPLPPKFDRTVGARIKAKRLKLGLSNEQLSRALGKSEAQIFRYQSGDSRCDGEMLSRFAKALGCTVSDLVEGK